LDGQKAAVVIFGYAMNVWWIFLWNGRKTKKEDNMQKGKSLAELAAAVQDISDNKKDYVVPSDIMYANKGKIGMGLVGEYTPREIFHEQLSTKLQIPKVYYDRMRENDIDLWDHNINVWLGKSK
jgi:hypothetical protein